MQIVLRVLVTLLGLGGAAGAVFAATMADVGMSAAEKKICDGLGVSSIEAILKQAQINTKAKGLTPAEAEQLNSGLEVYLRISRGIWFLYGAGAFGVLGIVFALLSMGKSAAAFLLTAIIPAVVILPLLLVLLIGVFIAALPAAGLLAIFIRAPRPSPALSDE